MPWALSSRFRIPDAGHLGIAVSAGGNIALVEGMGGESCQMFGGDNSLVGGRMGQERGATNIPNGVDVGEVGLVHGVGGDESLFGDNAQVC